MYYVPLFCFLSIHNFPTIVNLTICIWLCLNASSSRCVQLRTEKKSAGKVVKSFKIFDIKKSRLENQEIQIAKMSLVELAQIENLLFLNLLRNPNGDPEHARYTIRLQRHLERVRLETMNEERLALQKTVQYCVYVQVLFGTYLTVAGSGSGCMGFGLYSRNLAFFIAGYLVNIMGMIWTVCQIFAFVGLRNW